MADDLSLLLRIRGDASGAKNAAAETRTAIAQLRTSLQSAQGSFQAIGGPLTGFSGQLGNASSLLSVLQTDAVATGGALAGMAGPIGIAVAAFAALATGVITLSKQFIDLTISTAQWEGKLYDLSQQTGVSVETLSALEAVAETTGGSIEGVAQSLVLFQRNLAEAAGNSTSKAGEQFEKLSISTHNTEEALRDAFKALAAMPEGFRQTNAAAELFGARGGKQVLAILKETGGDIDATVEKLRALDQLITTDVARTADGLNDQLRTTQRQFRGLQAQIVNESMPVIIKALESLSRILRENRETFILLGQAIGLLLQGNLRILAPALDVASRAVDGHRRALLPLIEAYDRLRAVMQIVSGNIPNVDPNAIPAVGAPPVVSFGGSATLGGGLFRPKGIGGGGGGGSSVAQISAGQQLLNQLTDEYNRLQEKANDLSKIKIVALEILDQKYKNLSPTLRDQIFQQAALIDAAEKKADLDKRTAQATEKIRALLNSQTEAIKNARIGEEEWTVQIVELEAELKKLGLTMDDNTKKLLLDNAATQKALELTRERIALEETRIQMMERERLATPERKQEQLEKESGIFRSEGDEERPRKVTDILKDQVDVVGTLRGAYEGLASSIASGVGSMIENFILMGKVGPDAFKKIVAAALASVAARAAADAIYELAIGFAALTPWGAAIYGPAVMHFKAAALLGSIAAVAGVAGRAVAGNSFSGGGEGAGGGVGGSATQPSQSRQINSIKEEWRQPAAPQIIILRVESNDSHIVKVLKDDVSVNGPMRKLIVETANG